MSEKPLQVNISYKNIIDIAWPVMLAGLVANVITFTDTAFLARVSEVKLNAANLGGLFYLTLLMIANGISSGSQIMIARRAGENKKSEIGKVLDQSLYIFGLSALFLIIVAFAGGPYLLHSIVKDDLTYNTVLSYLNFRNWGLLFSFMLFAFRGFFVGIADTRVIVVGALIMAVVNIFLDYVLIFGELGFPRMEEAGAGLASTIAEAVAVIYVLIYSVAFGYKKKFDFFRFRLPSREISKHLFRLSYPLVLQLVTAYGAWFVFFIFIENVGTRELAVSSLVRVVYMILIIPIWGFATAANTMVSNIIGQGKQRRLNILIFKIISITLIIYVGLDLIAFFAAKPILMAVAGEGNPSLVNDSKYLMRIVLLFYFVITPTVILFHSLSGTGDIMAVLVIEIIAVVLYLVYTYFFTLFNFVSLEVAWCGELVYWGVIGILSYFRLNSGRWKQFSY